MTKDDAVRMAIEHVQAAGLEVGPVVDVRHVDLSDLDEMARGCPPELLETYESVRRKFRNQWVVSFGRKVIPGQVSCPDTDTLCVFETGEVAILSSP